uniref:Uncharacterized protein n=1 Tax=Timema monikensis TaxID=170555 RepID=A0A7R9E7L7_9NEOP|nr:unnamed protein product [Timema monikensis]
MYGRNQEQQQMHSALVDIQYTTDETKSRSVMNPELLPSHTVNSMNLARVLSRLHHNSYEDMDEIGSQWGNNSSPGAGDEEKKAPQKFEKKNNSLPLWGNERTMNLNPLILTNIQSSHYFKVVKQANTPSTNSYVRPSVKEMLPHENEETKELSTPQLQRLVFLQQFELHKIQIQKRKKN